MDDEALQASAPGQPMRAYEVGQLFTELLGLPKNTRAFAFYCEAGHAPTVVAEYFPDIEREPAKLAFAHFRLQRVTGLGDFDMPGAPDDIGGVAGASPEPGA